MPYVPPANASSLDALLRSHGFKIFSRPKTRPPRWADAKGRTYTVEEALAIVARREGERGG